MFMLINLLILIVGFVILIKSADFLVDGASSLAKKLGLTTLVIGLTIVALGTSAPEMIVNIVSSYQGKTNIAIGNIIGSNICNILLILGVCGLIRELPSPSHTTWKEIPFALLSILAVGILSFDKIFSNSPNNILSFGDGLILIFFFIIFLYYTYSISKETNKNSLEIKNFSKTKSIILIISGIIGLIIGGKLVVDSAVNLARAFSVSEALIGLTIIAIGTSLPELVTSAVATYKKQSHIAIGNIVGSNIFNIFFILGISAVIRPLSVSTDLWFDFTITIAVTLLLFTLMLIGKKYVLQRWQGSILIISYVAYIGFLIWRG